jgi:hypothetical protein
VGTLDLLDAQYNHDVCACGADPGYWSVESYDQSIFVTASVDAVTGILTYTSQGPDALVKQYGAIILKYCCGLISTYVYVIIGIADLCNCAECGQCENCDECTGVCLDIAVDSSVEPIIKSSNTSVNVTAT